jgi:hypothetical protein
MTDMIAALIVYGALFLVAIWVVAVIASVIVSIGENW